MTDGQRDATGTVEGLAGTLSPAGQWRETAFETGSYGPDDRDGLAASLERDGATLAVVPVRFERSGNRERVTSLVPDRTPLEVGDRTSVAPDVNARTAFATVARYRPGERTRTDVPTVAHDAGDALAAAVWLTHRSATDWALERSLRLHRGQGTTAADVGVSDDDALGALFVERPERCARTGAPTRSHELTLPLRYLPALHGAKRTPRDVLRVPSTVHELAGVVSHDAWVEAGLDAVDTAAPVERRAAGRYELADEVMDAVRGMDAAAFSLRRLGDPSPFA